MQRYPLKKREEIDQNIDEIAFKRQKFEKESIFSKGFVMVFRLLLLLVYILNLFLQQTSKYLQVSKENLELKEKIRVLEKKLKDFQSFKLKNEQKVYPEQLKVYIARLFCEVGVSSNKMKLCLEICSQLFGRPIEGVFFDRKTVINWSFQVNEYLKYQVRQELKNDSDGSLVHDMTTKEKSSIVVFMCHRKMARQCV